MTFILGARCSDGVVIVGDRKVTIGADFEYQDKEQESFKGVVWASSGIKALFNSLNNRVTIQIRKNRPKHIEDFLVIVEEAYEDMAKIYHNVLKYGLEILIAHRFAQGGKKSVLYYIREVGAAEHIPDFKLIGNGSPYASMLLKEAKKQNPNLTMEQVAKLGYLVIKYIEKYELDTSVGIGEEHPQIWFIPDGKDPYEIKGDDMDNCKKDADNRLERLASGFNGVFEFTS